jgi:putative membrane-bound dehydrogenase-like protein
MSRSLSMLVAISICFLLLPNDGMHAQPDATVKIPLNGHTFTLPAGFTIELAAKAPLVDRPITIALDEQGRLYAADSSGSNENVNIQLKKKPHRIVRLEDKDGDGVYDASTVFADSMMFPEGTMWHRGSLYVAAPPSIWKLTDKDGDGVADDRVEWFQGKTLTGCANDLHGPYLGPDGWIYWCKGAFAEQTYDIEGKKFQTRAAHIFRARPDGSRIEPLITGGMDNPVDCAFLPGGEMFFTSTFIQYPAAGKRDGLLHGVRGGLYGKEHLDVLNPHRWTSPKLMPVMSHLGPAAPSGLTVTESRNLGPEYQHNVFVCEFNLQKVSRHVLTPDGATFRDRASDFVVSDNKDFHPTDVIEDADGSLLIVDTSGWYKLCCPSSQLVKTDVLGAIYRVRRAAIKQTADWRGNKIDWNGVPVQVLGDLLADPRPAVRQRAKEKLRELGDAAIPTLANNLRSQPGGLRALETIWSLAGIDSPAAREAARIGLTSTDPDVRSVAIRTAGQWKDAGAREALVKILREDSPKRADHRDQHRRAAAEALGRIGNAQDAGAILAALAEPHDEVLHHALVFALMEMNVPADTLLKHESKSADVRRAILMVLDSTGEVSRHVNLVISALTDGDRELRATAWWIASRHPEWGQSLAAHLNELLSAELPVQDRDELRDRLAKLARSPAIQTLLAARLIDVKAKLPAKRLALQAMAQANLKDVPAAWMSGLAEAIMTPGLTADAVATARALRLPKSTPRELTAALAHIGGDSLQPRAVRLAALSAWPGEKHPLLDESFAILLQAIDSRELAAERSLAAEALLRSQLDSTRLKRIADALPAASPLELDKLLELFASSKDADVGMRLFDALKDSKLRPFLRADVIERLAKNFGPTFDESATFLLKSIRVDRGEQIARLEDLLKSLPAGNIARGHAVFNGTKASCMACHTIGYVGGKTGPDLTRIGQVRTRRDLLESILFPSASFVRGYEPIVVVMTDGKTHNGLIKSETADEITLTVGPSQDVRLSRSSIEEMQPSRVSVMPAGLDQQISRDELADLLAFLEACR